MELSIIMVAHNRLEQLKRTLPSILEQDVECEMVIVDDGSRDGTHRWIDTLNIPHSKLIRISTHGWRNPSYARNLGVSCAEGDIVLVQDGEVLHESDKNLERVLHHFTEWEGPEPLLVKPLSLWTEEKGFAPVFQPHYVKIGIFLAMLREEFIGLGGYNEKWYTQWGHEDVDFIRRVGCAGFKGIEDPEILIRHLVHETVPDGEGNETQFYKEGKLESTYGARISQGKARPVIKWRH